MENDNRKGGLAEHVDFGARGLNTWTTRFYGIDPLWAKYPNMSSFAFANNSPIAFFDKDGREVYYAADGTRLGQIGSSTQVVVVSDEYVKTAKYTIDNFNNLGKGQESYCDQESLCFEELNSSSNSRRLGMTEEELNVRAMLYTMLIATKSC